MNMNEMKSFTKQHKITMEMLYIILLVHKDNKSELKSYVSIVKQYREKVLLPTEIKALVDKNFIVKTTDKKYRTTEYFASLFKDGNTFADKFYNEYPDFIKGTEGKHFPLKKVDIRLFRDLYNLKVTTLQEHKRLLSILDYAKENNYGLLRIDSFIKNEVYEGIYKDMKNTVSIEGTNVEHNF